MESYPKYNPLRLAVRSEKNKQKTMITSEHGAHLDRARLHGNELPAVSRDVVVAPYLQRDLQGALSMESAKDRVPLGYSYHACEMTRVAHDSAPHLASNDSHPARTQLLSTGFVHGTRFFFFDLLKLGQGAQNLCH